MEEFNIPKNYNPKEIEDKWYQFWLEHDCFKSVPDQNKEPFTILIPPPNANNPLHIGHALNNTLQDIVARYKRLQDFNVLWIPGTDHGGISTQFVVEKELLKEGLTKHVLGREEFIKKVWEWKEEKSKIIIDQLKKLGCSCDWSREQFTMNENLSKWTKKAFVELYNKGLIYKDKYIINWCCHCETALSDDEVEHIDNKNGKLYYIRYQCNDHINCNNKLTIATTRPETIFADEWIGLNVEKN